MTSKRRLFYGIDRFLFESSHKLKGKRIGLFTNNSALTAAIPGPRVPARLALQRAGLKISCLFANSHGLFLESSDSPPPTTDPLTQIPIVNLPSLKAESVKQLLGSLDAVVIDLPDSGIRFYSDLGTLVSLLGACAFLGIPIWIFDRPNPLGGLMKWVEGPLAMAHSHSLKSQSIRIPIRHSLTLAEIASIWHHENGYNNPLHVSRMDGWERRLMLPNLGLPQTPIHPGIPDFRTLVLASCTGIFSSLNINFGIGSPYAFRVIGAPWINAQDLQTAVNENSFQGVDFHPTYFRAVSPPYQGEVCGGIMIHITKPTLFKPIETSLRLIHLLHLFYPEKCTWRPGSNWSGISQSTSNIFGRDDIPRDLPRLPFSRAEHVKSWTNVKGWMSYTKNWLLY